MSPEPPATAAGSTVATDPARVPVPRRPDAGARRGAGDHPDLPARTAGKAAADPAAAPGAAIGPAGGADPSGAAGRPGSAAGGAAEAVRTPLHRKVRALLGRSVGAGRPCTGTDGALGPLISVHLRTRPADADIPTLERAYAGA